MYLDYEQDGEPQELLQGDIVGEYPFSFVPLLEDFLIIRQEEGHLKAYKLNDLEDKFNLVNNFEEQLVINARLNKIILLSQSCDIKYRETIMIAPIYDLSFLKGQFEALGNLTEQKIEDRLNSLRNSKFERQIHYFFYLPATTNFPESYVDFNSIISIPKSNINIRNRILSLSDKGRHWLAYKLNHFFGRPVEFS